MNEDSLPRPFFTQKFNDFLRSRDFPEVFFHNTYGYVSALQSDQYKHLVEEYESNKNNTR